MAETDTTSPTFSPISFIARVPSVAPPNVTDVGAAVTVPANLYGIRFTPRRRTAGRRIVAITPSPVERVDRSSLASARRRSARPPSLLAEQRPRRQQDQWSLERPR